MRLAILSDTHGLLRPQVAEYLKTADAILHGGDINKQSIVDELRQYAPLYIVRGNNDKAWAEAIPYCHSGRCDLYHGPQQERGPGGPDRRECGGVWSLP